MDKALYVQQINEQLASLCSRFQVPVYINTFNDPNMSSFRAYEQDGTFIIDANTATIPLTEYESCIGYQVGKILLPRLNLETERLILRRFQPEDADKCLSFLSNTQDAYMDCCKAFHVMDEAYYERVALFGERETQYLVVLKSSNEVIGTINVFEDNSRAVDAMEIGYSISHSHQRKGYAFEALSALLDLLKNKLGLMMVTAGILPENTASKLLLSKLGFCQEGLRHKAIWHEALDEPVDLIYFYRDKPEKNQDSLD